MPAPCERRTLRLHRDRTRVEGSRPIADTIMYRWSAERDVWVSDDEVEQVREYLARVG